MKTRTAALAIALTWTTLGWGGTKAPEPASSAATVTATQLAALIRRADSAVIAFEHWKDQRQSTDAVVHDRAWIEKLAAIIESGPLEPRPVCFCMSSPRIELYTTQGRLTQLTLHHHTKLRYTDAAVGDFEIGAARSRAILDLALAEKKSARERVLPKLKDSRAKR